jgi:hypothetical protein
MYIETSAPRRPNDRARLVSPSYPPTASSCLKFYYNMYGASIGSLRVYKGGATTSPVTLLFQQTGNQVREWCSDDLE